MQLEIGFFSIVSCAVKRFKIFDLFCRQANTAAAQKHDSSQRTDVLERERETLLLANPSGAKHENANQLPYANRPLPNTVDLTELDYEIPQPLNNSSTRPEMNKIDYEIPLPIGTSTIT